MRSGSLSGLTIEQNEPMREQSEQIISDLLNRIAQGDDKAATALYRHYHGFVYAYLRYRMSDEQAAEEAANDVFLAVCRNPMAYQGNAKFSTWLCAIAKNKAADRLRKHGRSVPLVEDSNELLAGIPDPEPDVIDRMGEAQNAEIVRRCIEALPEKHREAVFLAYYEEAGMLEIARRTKCPEGTVKSRLSHARAKLLDCVSGWLGGGRND
jgi:RNA polymerase sigma-70 factor (ECF subfamily)